MSKRKLRRWRSAKPKKRPFRSAFGSQLLEAIMELERGLKLADVGLVRYQPVLLTALGTEVQHMVPVIRLWLSR